MAFKISKISNYGTSTPAVARTLMQGSELMDVFPISKEVKESMKTILFDLQRQLLKCQEIADSLRSDINNINDDVKANGIKTQSGGRVIEMPFVVNLESKAELFLHSAKLAIREAGKILDPIWGEDFDHRFNRIVQWAVAKFGPDSLITKAIQDHEKWVSMIINMRNAVDHPHDRDGEILYIFNYEFKNEADGRELIEPTWCLKGNPRTLILNDMDYIIEGILSISEELLCMSLIEHKGKWPLVIYEIPENERDKNFPIRFRVGLEKFDA